MELFLNGNAHSTSAGTVEELVATLTDSPAGVAVAIDETVVPRSQWNTKLYQGARIDVLGAVQGG